MNDYQKAAVQNVRVWARRYGLNADVEKLGSSCINNFPGSVLKGPLTVVIYFHLKDLIPEVKDRKHAAAAAASALAALIRNEAKSNNILTSLAMTCESGVLAKYSPVLCSTVIKGLDARNSEKSKPNLMNAMAMKVHKRPHFYIEDSDESFGLG